MKLSYRIIPVMGMPRIRPLQNFSLELVRHLKAKGPVPMENDIFVISHKVVSIGEGSVVKINEIVISDFARELAKKLDAYPARVALALKEAASIIREAPVLITETKHGIMTDFSAIDQSNAPEGHMVTLPEDPDASAFEIRSLILSEFGVKVGVIITDTQGRPWRRGAINVAIGISGLNPFIDNSGKEDLYGYKLRSSLVCLADELASAAELVMGQSDEGIPVAMIRGLRIEQSNQNARSILRPKKANLFR